MRSEYDFSKAKKGKTAKEIKILKTVRLDPEVVQWLEIEAEKQGMGYQTFLNWFLRQSMTDKSTVEQRLEKLERAVFKKK
ncbi:hypothetical protein D3C87_1330580 [compost metagenome]